MFRIVRTFHKHISTQFVQPNHVRIFSQAWISTSAPKNAMKAQTKRFVVQEKIELLMKYKEIYGNLNVNRNFKIPSTDMWPTSYHGYSIGYLLSYIRSLHKADKLHPISYAALCNLGFIWDNSTYKYETIIHAFSTYKRIHNQTKIPPQFVIPSQCTEWPPETWNLPLGKIASNIQQSKSYKSLKPSLQTLGFQFLSQRQQFPDIYDALVTYKTIHGHLRIPQSYIIPFEDTRYPMILRGKSLGIIVKHIRNRKAYQQHQTQLESIGFIYSPTKAQIKLIVQAITRYQELNGHVKIPKQYSIPSGCADYPKECWEMSLGRIVHRIQHEHTYEEYQDTFQHLGILTKRDDTSTSPQQPDNTLPIQSSTTTTATIQEQKRFETFQWIQIALRQYQALYGNVFVPRKYVIPHNSKEYPSEIWGMKLGNFVSDLRWKGIYRDYVPALVKEFDLQIPNSSSASSASASSTITTKQDFRDSLSTNKKKKKNQKKPKKVLIVQQTDSTHQQEISSKSLQPSSSSTNTNTNTNTSSLGNSRQRRRIPVVPVVTITIPFPDFYQACLTYHSLHHHLCIPESYPIAIEDVSYPPTVRGCDFGAYAHHLRRRNSLLSPQQLQSLTAIGFVTSAGMFRFQQILMALAWYEDTIGAVHTIPVRYVIPTITTDITTEEDGIVDGKKDGTPPLPLPSTPLPSLPSPPIPSIPSPPTPPQCIQGIALGKKLQHMVKVGTYVDCIETVLAATPSTVTTMETQLRDVLIRYLKAQQHLSSSSSIGRPSVDKNADKHEDENEPFTIADWKKIQSLHQRIKKDDRVEKIIQAIEQYQAVNGKEKIIPRRYSIPRHSPSFHESLWSMHIGDIVQSIRLKGMHSKYRWKWIELGILEKEKEEEEEEGSI